MVFTSLAVVAVILGVIGGLKPELLGKHPAHEHEAAVSTTPADAKSIVPLIGKKHLICPPI